MRWWHQWRRNARQIAGVALLLVGLLLVVSWVQLDDPDCTLEQDFLTQLRMCDGDSAQSQKNASEHGKPWLLLIVGLTGFVAGAYLLASGNTQRAPDGADS